MDSHRAVWDREYFRRGRLWGGAPDDLPNIPPGSLVLELGCGDGKTLSAMRTKEWEIYAVDTSVQAINLSREVNGMRLSASIIKADAKYLPFADFSFDAVFAHHIIGHACQTGRKYMAIEAARVLKKGGTLFFKDFEREDMRAGTGEEIEPYTYLRGNGIITHYFSADEVISFFQGLSAVSVSIKRREIRVRGKNLQRSELEGIFKKPE
jgi:ubiquinone/menaquinone biosynthesis C-methylase UbiE